MTHAFRSTRVVLPSGVTPATLIVEQERITGIGEWRDVPSAVNVLDLGDLALLPGLVDTHVHINEPGRTEWEGFATATRAAAAGGVTTLVDMPLNCVPEIKSVAALQAKRAAAVGKAWVDWAAWGGVVRGNAQEHGRENENSPGALAQHGSNDEPEKKRELSHIRNGRPARCGHRACEPWCRRRRRLQHYELP